jgi:hypothetical protein
VSKLDYKAVKNSASYICNTCSKIDVTVEQSEENETNKDAMRKDFQSYITDGVQMSTEAKIDQMYKQFSEFQKFCEFLSNKLDDYEKDRKKNLSARGQSESIGKRKC